MTIQRFISLAAIAGFLAGCASEPVELVGYCGLDDPASEWVVANKLARQASQHCQGRYRILGKTATVQDSGHEYRWVIDCETADAP